jgi:hypothetical protein
MGRHSPGPAPADRSRTRTVARTGRDRRRRPRRGSVSPVRRVGRPSTAAAAVGQSAPPHPVYADEYPRPNSTLGRRTATEPGRDGREETDTSAINPITGFSPLRSPAGMAGKSPRVRPLPNRHTYRLTSHDGGGTTTATPVARLGAADGDGRPEDRESLRKLALIKPQGPLGRARCLGGPRRSLTDRGVAMTA